MIHYGLQLNTVIQEEIGVTTTVTSEPVFRENSVIYSIMCSIVEVAGPITGTISIEGSLDGVIFVEICPVAYAGSGNNLIDVRTTHQWTRMTVSVVGGSANITSTIMVPGST